MPEPNPYPGSPSLPAEAREKVMQTFRHTLELAKAGRNEEALLGCDFILKMDLRFGPAKRLLEVLRGVATGTIVDLSAFSEMTAAPPAPTVLPGSGAKTLHSLRTSAKPPQAAAPPSPQAPQAPPQPQPTVAASPAPWDAAAPQAPRPAPAPAAADPFGLSGGGLGSLGGLGFDELASSDPFAAPSAAPKPTPPPAPAFPASPPPPAAGFGFGPPPADPFSSGPDPFAAPPTPNPFAQSGLGAASSAPDPFAQSQIQPPSASPMFGASPDPFAPSAGSFGAGTPGGFGDFGFSPPPEFPAFPPTDAAPALSPLESAFASALPAPTPAPSSGPVGGPVAPASTTIDPRIVQFLRQGDDALSRGQVQEAIDLWSRVFLIDLSNEEASRRIDAAREKQAQTAQRIDVLLSEGVQSYDAGDFSTARGRFLDVLALSESDATARSYLNQIDAALAGEGSGGPAATARRDVDESSFASESESLDTPLDLGEAESAPELSPIADAAEAPAAKAKKLRIDARLLIAAAAAVLIGVGAAAYFLVLSRPKPDTSAPPNVPATTSATQVKPVGEDPLVKARALADQGKIEDAIVLLTGVPESDPRHAEAIQLIANLRSLPPTPATAANPATTSASLDEARAAGLAAFRACRYIETVKSLDKVVKERPADDEAREVLAKAREQVAAISSAVRAYNQQDYESAIKLLWEIRKKDLKNQDAEEYLFKSYFNDGVLRLQSGGFDKAGESFKEAAELRPNDVEAQRHLKFTKRYSKGATDLFSRVYSRHVTARS